MGKHETERSEDGKKKTEKTKERHEERKKKMRNNISHRKWRGVFLFTRNIKNGERERRREGGRKTPREGGKEGGRRERDVYRKKL